MTSSAYTMPGIINVEEFVRETKDDLASPTTSTFVGMMPQFRQSIACLEEVSHWFEWIGFGYRLF